MKFLYNELVLIKNTINEVLELSSLDKYFSYSIGDMVLTEELFKRIRKLLVNNKNLYLIDTPINSEECKIICNAMLEVLKLIDNFELKSQTGFNIDEYLVLLKKIYLFLLN